MHETALNLLKIIEDNGYNAYIVGGYPRDIYLDRQSADIDICTNATPKELKDIFGDSMLPKVNYGSITVVMNKIRFEITTFRKDIKYENNRKPVNIEYIDNLYEDLQRRDFTINTLCINKDGDVLDLLDGKQDIDNKIIRMVGNPQIKLSEDALRILRAIRFSTTLNFTIDDELKKFIKEYKNLLKNLSYQRKKEELDKIFSSNNVSYGIELIKELELSSSLELNNIDNLVITTSPIGIWAQLDTLNTYKFTNNEKDMIININELLTEDILNPIILYKYDLYLIEIVGEIKGIDKKLIINNYNDLVIKSRKDINITSIEICKILNLNPGPFIKDIYEELEIKILNKELDNNYEKIKEYIIKKKS